MTGDIPPSPKTTEGAQRCLFRTGGGDKTHPRCLQEGLAHGHFKDSSFFPLSLHRCSFFPCCSGFPMDLDKGGAGMGLQAPAAAHSQPPVHGEPLLGNASCPAQRCVNVAWDVQG